ncbi:hypothetical protein GCM10027040_31260 [Halomonas shantousis]
MMEQEGRVVAVRDGQAWIETQRRSGCSGCQARSGCAQGMLTKWWHRPHHLTIDFDKSLPLAENDRIVLGIEERIYLQGVALLYGIPLMTAIIMGGLAEQWAGRGALLVPGGFVLGLILGLLGVSWHSRRDASRAFYRPVLLRRIRPSGRNE